MEEFNEEIIRAIIDAYMEDRIHSHYPPKDRLIYALCHQPEDKRKVTLQEIEKCNDLIKELDVDELSVGFIRDRIIFKSEPNFEKQTESDKFWLSRFTQEVEMNLESYRSITDLSHEYFNTNELDDNCFSNQSGFWDECADYLQPKISDLISVIEAEFYMFGDIRSIQKEYSKSKYWEIDIDELIVYKEYNRLFQFIIDIAELLVQLYRREMFIEFLKYEEEENVYNKFDINDKLVFACSKLQGDKKYWGNKASENDRNRYVANLIEIATLKEYSVKDQPQWSKSSTGIDSGELDILLIEKNGLPVSIIEGLNLNSLRTSKVSEHLNRLFNYDTTGLRRNYHIIYSTANNFISLWNRYKKYVTQFEFKYKLLKFEELNDYGFSDIKIAKSIHRRNTNDVECIHIMINMKER